VLYKLVEMWFSTNMKYLTLNFKHLLLINHWFKKVNY